MFQLFKHLFCGEEAISPIEYGIAVAFLWAVTIWSVNLLGW